MRLNINLATKPYEDVRKFLARWGTLTLLLAIATALLLIQAVSNYRSTRLLNSQIAEKQQKIDALEKDRANAIETLNRPENKTVATASRFFNEQIQRKSLSWTRIFMDLERIMPPGLHVVSIAPEMNKDNQLIIHLLVGGSSHDRAVLLVQRMEESGTFKRAELRSEQMVQGTTDPVQFEITSVYVPAQPPATKSGATTTQAMADRGGAR